MALTISGDGTITGLAGTGLDLVTSSTFSAVSTVSVDGCFTSAYDDYRLIVKFTPSTGGQVVYMRMRAASTDASGAGTYVYGGTQAASSTGISAFAGAESGGRISATNGTTSVHGITIDLTSPAVAEYTNILLNGFRPNGGATGYQETSGGVHAVATAYDGITIYPAAGTFTGSLYIYGYRKA